MLSVTAVLSLTAPVIRWCKASDSASPGYWNPIRELFVKPFVRRTIEGSALIGTSAYLNSAAGLDIDYRVRLNIKVDGHFAYSVADYSVSSTTAGR